MAIDRRQRGTVKIGSSRLHFGIRPLFPSPSSSPTLPSSGALTPIPAALLLSFLLSFSRQLSILLLLAPPSSAVRPRFPPVVMHSLAQKGEWVVQNLVEEYCDDILRMTDGTKRDLTSSSLSRYVNCVFLVPKKLESTLRLLLTPSSIPSHVSRPSSFNVTLTNPYVH